MDFTVCNTTREFVTFDEHGDEVCRRVYTESTLVSSDDTIVEAKKEFIEQDSYLNSARWQNKRQQVLRRDNFVCQKCGSAKNLNVHHLTYEHFGREPLEDLITLCKDCHKNTHAKDLGINVVSQKYSRKPANNTFVDIRDIEEIVIAYVFQNIDSLDFFGCVAPSDFTYYGDLYDCICGTYLDDEEGNFGVEMVIEEMERLGMFKSKKYGKRSIRKIATRDISKEDINKCVCIITGEQEA